MNNAACPFDESAPTDASAVKPCEAAPFTFKAVRGGPEGFEGRDLILKYHYSKSFHPAYVLMGLAFKGEECVAACCFRTPSARWAIPVLDLGRLVRKEGVAVSLTWLISNTVNAVRRAGNYHLLVSYADNTHGHHGGVYQAASWNYSGKTPRQNDGVMVDGNFIAGRACNNMFGTRSVDKLRLMFPERSFEKHWDEGKYLYWRSLNRQGDKAAAILGLKKLPYVKPLIGGCHDHDLRARNVSPLSPTELR